MKAKIKKLSLSAIVLAAMAALVFALGACSGGQEEAPFVDDTEYETLDYAGFCDVPESYWDHKTIAYQVVSSSVADPETANAAGDDNSLRSCVLVNLYDDGTLLYYQIGVYNVDGLPDPVWYDEARHISWAHFGFWDLAADGNSIDIWYLGQKSTAGALEKTQDWVNKSETGYNFHYTATKGSDGKFSIDCENEDNAAVPKTLGFNTNAEAMVIRENWVFRTGDDIVYNNIASFIAAATKGSDDWLGI